MSRVFLTPLDLAQNELQNATVQNLAVSPSSPTPKKGQLYFNTGDNTMYWYDGSGWVSSRGGTVTFPGYGSSTATTTFGLAKSDGSSGSASRSDHTHGTPTHDQAAHSGMSLAPTGAAGGDLAGTYPNPTIGLLKVTDAHVAAANKDGADATVSMRTLGYTAAKAMPGVARLDQIASPTTFVNMNLQKLTNVGDPTNPGDATNKQYVDNAVQGLDAKASVRLATTTNILPLSGNQTVDGSAVVTGDRILVKNQTTAGGNGVWIANTSGVWTRATDLDTWTEVPGAYVFVEEGSTQADTGWVSTAGPGGSLGTTAMPWVQFSGAGEYTAGAGLTLSGTTFNVGQGAGMLVGVDDIAPDFAASGGEYGTGTKVARGDHNHDARYVNTAGGDSMAGTLTFTGGTGTAISAPGMAINPGTMTASTITSTNQINGNSLSLSGSGAQFTLGGSFSSMTLTNLAAQVLLPAIAPTDPSHASPKSYVDAQIAATNKRFSANVGGAVSAVVAHNLNSRDVQIQVYRNSAPYDTVECDVERTDVNNVTLRFTIAPAANAFRCVVQG